MSDLGSDAGSSALNLYAKVMETLLRLLEKIFEAWQKAPERAEHKYKAMVAKNEQEKAKALQKLDGKMGYVNHRRLAKTGEPLSVTEICLTKEEAKIFNEICKREGLLYSAVTNMQLKKDGEKANIIIECRTADLERLKRAVERFNEEIKIKWIDNEISDVLSKGEENLSKSDRQKLNELVRQKEEIQRGYCDRLNENMQDIVLDNVFDESKLKAMEIGEALNRNTGRCIDKDQYTIIADAHDPGKIIRCHGYEDNDPETGKSYIKTEYEVYHDGKCILKTDDGRFEGREKDYWLKEKQKIEQAADFSGTYYKFFNENEYQRWTDHVNEQNKAELSEMEKPQDIKDYSKCKDDALKKLKENGAEIREGEAYSIETDRALKDYIKEETGITPKEKALAAESIIICKQINNYEEIERLKDHIDVANANLILTKEGTKEYDIALEDVKNTENKLEAAYECDRALLEERKDINAVQSVQELDETEYEIQEEEQGQQEKMTMDEAKDEIEKMKNEDKSKEACGNEPAANREVKDVKMPDRAD